MDFLQLAHTIKNKLYRFALRITGDDAEAQDVVQEVFIKIWSKRDEMATINNQEAYCMTLTRNLSLDKIRSKHHQKMQIDEIVELIDGASTPDAIVEATNTIDTIRLWMQKLPEKQRIAMHLRDIEGLTYEEISIILEMPMPQVKINLHRARQAMREKILATEHKNLKSK
jgi:RNA polymerase sigma factor (sigma-70 family)